MTSISIIIPTFNEAGSIERTLDALNLHDLEIIIVDGGSQDQTVAIANAHQKIVIHSEPGRAKQMNRGAAAASGDMLLFLHADTLVSRQGLQSLLNLEADEIGGAYYRFFDSSSLFLKLTCCLANLRTKCTGVALGDQAIFVRKEVFQQLNGFNEALPYGEDLDFSLRLRQVGKTVTLGPAVQSSARRFLKLGPIRQTLKDLWLTFELLRFKDDS